MSFTSDLDVKRHFSQRHRRPLARLKRKEVLIKQARAEKMLEDRCYLEEAIFLRSKIIPIEQKLQKIAQMPITYLTMLIIWLPFILLLEEKSAMATPYVLLGVVWGVFVLILTIYSLDLSISSLLICIQWVLSVWNKPALLIFVVGLAFYYLYAVLLRHRLKRLLAQLDAGFSQRQNVMNRQ